MKNENGVTMITLIITVVLMVLIAGVSIYTLIGDNQLMSKTTDEQQKQSFLLFKQEIELDLLEIMDVVGMNVSLTDNKIIDKLEYRGYIVTKKGETLILDKNDMRARINIDFTVNVVGYDI